MEIFSVSSMPYVWLAVMVLCIIIEACTVALTSVWGAISAFVLVFVSRTGMPIHYQILLFLVLAIVLMVCTRPFAVKKLHVGKEETNAGALIGSEVLVVRAVEPFQKGEAKGRGGVVWSATSVNGQSIAHGVVCTVVDIKGNTLVITPKEKGVN